MNWTYRPDPKGIQEVARDALRVFRRWKGSGVAISREDLCRKLDCNDRTLRQAVRELRCQGYLIVADPDTGGYRCARRGEEVYAYTGTLVSRIRSLREVVDAMEDSARREFGPKQEQMELL